MGWAALLGYNMCAVHRYLYFIWGPTCAKHSCPFARCLHAEEPAGGQRRVCVRWTVGNDTA